MSNILVVQPHRVLQHAFVIALFPEHHVQLTDNIPDAENIAQADLVIVDAGALRARQLLTGEELSRIQSWGVPVLWIEENASGGGMHLTLPVSRDELRSAVANCLRSPSTPRSPVVRAAKGAERATPAVEATEAEKEVIELVDVFEEASGPEEVDMHASNKE
jgi:hypothetical protein